MPQGTLRYGFYVDECLTPKLVARANARGYHAEHAAYVGMAGAPDWSVTARSVENDMVTVTNDRADYLRTYARQNVHPGLAISVPSVNAAERLRLFGVLLDHLDRWNSDLMNKVIEVERDGSIHIYDWPEPETSDETP